MRYAISDKLFGDTVALGVALILVTPAFGGDSNRGKAIFALAAGCGCHTPQGGPVGAGGRPLATPFGTFYSTNITADAETGLGRWTDAEVRAAIRSGDRRDGSVEAPVMPYYQYAGMADEDVEDLIAFLRTLPPVRNENRPPDTPVPMPRLVYRGWRWWFTRTIVAPARAPAVAVDRGRYVVDHVSLCGDCHTPRTRFGALRGDRYLAGTRHGPDGKSVPNITPDTTTGLGDWTTDELVDVLRSGMLPDLDNVQGLMAEMVDGYGGGPGYKDAPENDLRAVASYLKMVPPIVHDVREKH